MKTLYIDCSMGAAGDMLTAALLELTEDRTVALEKLNAMGLPGVRFAGEKAVKCGITGTHMKVIVHGTEEDDHLHDHSHHEHSHGNGNHHSHNSMDYIRALVGKLRLPSAVKLDVLSVYEEIAEAESAVHGVSVEHIHFHEVGTLDAVADIAGACYLLYMLKVQQVVCSPIHVGSGTVRCAHGILPVPAPATARILQGIPTYAGDIRGELCTPTGAALLRHFATGFGSQPSMTTEKIGYGMGKKDFPQANCVRVLLGDTLASVRSLPGASRETVWELRCNVDDMTGEALGFALERLLEEGALDAWIQPVVMKKSRPGYVVCVLCREALRLPLVTALFRHTTTLGVREQAMGRYALDRHMERVDTPLGPIRRKVSQGYGVCRTKWEYEDLAKAAREKGMGLDRVLEILNRDQ